MADPARRRSAVLPDLLDWLNAPWGGRPGVRFLDQRNAPGRRQRALVSSGPDFTLPQTTPDPRGGVTGGLGNNEGRRCRQHPSDLQPRIPVRDATRRRCFFMNQPDEQPARRGRGHTSVPHTADLRIEAWGPTREDCIAEAVRGLVESFADISEATHQRSSSATLMPAPTPTSWLPQLRKSSTTWTPMGRSQRRLRRAGPPTAVYLMLRVVDAAAAEIIGAAPKAASLSGLTCAPDASGRWMCAVTIDV